MIRASFIESQLAGISSRRILPRKGSPDVWNSFTALKAKSAYEKIVREARKPYVSKLTKWQRQRLPEEEAQALAEEAERERKKTHDRELTKMLKMDDAMIVTNEMKDKLFDARVCAGLSQEEAGCVIGWSRKKLRGVECAECRSKYYMKADIRRLVKLYRSMGAKIEL